MLPQININYNSQKTALFNMIKVFGIKLEIFISLFTHLIYSCLYVAPLPIKLQLGTAVESLCYNYRKQ